MITDNVFEFWLEEMEVGLFEASFPRTPGRYRYMPYRGQGHSDMQAKLSAGEPAVCHFLDDGWKVSFTITRCPEYGVVKVSDINLPNSN